jgi:chloramphenicol-sensitive protein RarD
VWSWILALIFLIVGGGWKEVLSLRRNSRFLKGSWSAATLLTINWFLFVWAVTHDRILETVLGYLISPLLSVLLGYFFLKEEIDHWGRKALILATGGVGVMLTKVEEFPWIALGLALTYGVYSLIRKLMPRAQGLTASFYELNFMMIYAVPIMIYFITQGQAWWLLSGSDQAWVALSGVITLMPMIWFMAAAARLPLTSLGFMLYLGPITNFCVGWFVYNERLSSIRIMAFLLILLAVILNAMRLVWNQIPVNQKQSRPKI